MRCCVREPGGGLAAGLANRGVAGSGRGWWPGWASALTGSVWMFHVQAKQVKQLSDRVDLVKKGVVGGVRGEREGPQCGPTAAARAARHATWLAHACSLLKEAQGWGRGWAGLLGRGVEVRLCGRV